MNIIQFGGHAIKIFTTENIKFNKILELNFHLLKICQEMIKEFREIQLLIYKFTLVIQSVIRPKNYYKSNKYNVFIFFFNPRQTVKSICILKWFETRSLRPIENIMHYYAVCLSN